MSGMTQTSLIAQIISYMNRTDTQFTAQIPNLINQAIELLSREVKNIGYEVVAVGTMIPNNPVQAKPGRWRTTLAINIGSGTNLNSRSPVLARSYDYLRNYWPEDTQTELPKFYADYGYSNWLFVGTPDQAYPYEVSYLELPVSLTSSQQTNWLTNYAPTILLYGALLQCVPYLKNTELVPSWESFYRLGVDGLKSENHSRLVDRQSNVQQDKPPANQD